MIHSEIENILKKSSDFFKDEIVAIHLNNSCQKASQLKNYNINPFLISYLAKFLRGNDEPRSIAEALIYPRILGTSISTTFGSKVQKFISQVLQGYGSTTSGIDIEFVDAIDGRKKYCQVKSGPNTINKDDIETIFQHFNAIKNLARTNNIDIGLNDLTVGVLYGKPDELSHHYKAIDKNYPVRIGQDFWYRLTGEERFYSMLIKSFSDAAIDVNGSQVLEETIDTLASEIKDHFKF